MIWPFSKKTEERDAAPSVGIEWSAPSSLLSPAASNAEGLATVLACVSAISSAIASLPVVCYRNGSKGSRTEVLKGNLPDLIRRGPNRYQSWPEMMEFIVAQILLRGNALVEIVSDGSGKVTALRPIPWEWTSVSMLPDGSLAYEVSFQPSVFTRSTTRRILSADVVHVRDRSDDGIIGVSRLKRGAAILNTALNADRRADLNFRNGIRPSGVLKTEQRLDEGQRKALRESMARAFSGASSESGGAMVLGSGLDWTSMPMISPEDSELLASRKWSSEEICRLFQVPPPLVQDFSKNTFTNSQEATRWFASFCLLPIVRKLETSFNAALWPSGAMELALDMSGFDRGDRQSRWTAHAAAVGAGILTIDEVRELEGYGPLKGSSVD